ncbi:MAG: hypothetical protein HXX16_20120 [Bacteroidales bacterium]|nr:hypothetical protein [Bacteroidales bacterium]
MITIIVDVFLIFSDGSRVRTEITLKIAGQPQRKSVVDYIKENTPGCINVIILDVYHEVK